MLKVGRGLRGEKGLAYILGGNVGAQLISLAALPLLSRLFSPEDYGYYSLVLALVALIAPVATLRFESAAMLPTRNVEVRAAVWNAWLSTLVFALGAGVALQLLGAAGVGELEKYPYLAFWVFLLVTLTSGFTVLSQLALRKQQYALVARRTLFRSIATALPQVCLALVGRTNDGLLIGTTIGSVAGIMSVATRTREFLRFPGLREMKLVWWHYWRFPVIFAPSAALNSFGAQVPLLFLTAYYGLAIGGQLGMAERIVALPIGLIGSAVGQVIEAEASKRIRQSAGGLPALYLRYSLLLGVLGAGVALGMGVLGGWLVPLVLGEQWGLAGQIVQVLAVTSGVRLVAAPLSRFFILLQLSRANIILDLARVLLTLSGVAVILFFELQLLPALWILYSALSVTYVATWVYGLIVVRAHRPLPHLSD